MSYTHLTEQERYVISHLTIAEFSLREIARRINRHHTTVSRELKRIRSQYPYSVYWYDWTHPGGTKNAHRRRLPYLDRPD